MTKPIYKISAMGFLCERQPGGDKVLADLRIGLLEDADFILRAVNSHEALVEACQTMLGWINNNRLELPFGVEGSKHRLRTALALAEEKPE